VRAAPEGNNYTVRVNPDMMVCLPAIHSQYLPPDLAAQHTCGRDHSSALTHYLYCPHRRRYPEYVTPAMANAWATDVSNGKGSGFALLD
jgi:hypothetical protein